MKRKFFILLSLGIALAVNIYFRAFPIYFPQLKAHARNIVENIIQQGAVAEVSKKFPQFYPLAKEEIKKSRMTEYKRFNKKAVDEQIEGFYRKLKDRYQDDTGQTYIMELDCWHWTRYVKNVLNLGHPGDRVIGRAQWDMYMLAPTGWVILWDDFLYYLSAFLYKVFCLFHDVPLLTFLFYLPLFFIAICITVVYAASFRYGKYLGALITCLFIGLTPVFIPRSCAGWFDKDVLSMLFPVAIFGSYIASLAVRSFKHRFAWVFFTSFLVGLFAFTWTFWWFIFAIIFFYEVLSLACKWFLKVYVKKISPRLLKERVILFVSLIFFSFFWVIVLAGFEPMSDLYEQVKLALIFNKPLMTSIWPNVFSTVGELRRAGIPEMAHSIGGAQGLTLTAISLICMAVLFAQSMTNRRFGEPKRASITIIIIWFAAMAFAATRGVRFVMFLAPPVGMTLGWASGKLYYYVKKKNRVLGLVAGGMILLSLGTVLIRNGNSSAENCFPLMDDSWYKVLNIIKDKSPKDSTVNSWWDYGDWFKVIADRRVIFDGQSQGNPQAYWMAKALLTDDENKSASILRMLNNGGNEAFNIIDRNTKNPLLSALLLEGVMTISPERAEESLLKFLPSSEMQKVMRILFSRPAHACFVVDSSMPQKMGAISYLGNWDFSKVYIAQNFDKEEKAKIIDYLKSFGRDEQELQRLYQEVFLISTKNLDEWLSHRLQFYSGVLNGREKGGFVFFENGFTYNPDDGTLRSNTGQIPQSLFVAGDSGIKEKKYSRPNVVFSLLVYKNDTGYKMVMLDEELGKSIFVRLYFLRDKTLKYFVPFIDAEEGDNYIRVFSMAW